MITHLKEIFQKQARTKHFETVLALHACRMEDGQNVSTYVLNMKSHIGHLDRFGSPISNDLVTNLILNSLPKSFDTYVMHYNMNGWEKSILELNMMHKNI